MISPERVAEIRRLHESEKWKPGTIAKQLHVHHGTVRRVLTQAGVAPQAQSSRPSMVDGYLPFMLETLHKYPRLAASRLHTMVKERGYPGGPDHFRAVVARHRPRPVAEAYLRLKTLPGEQAQADWGHFGTLTIGRAKRPLWAFVMVLSFSRQVFLRFFPGASMPYFLRGHVEAFELFSGVPRTVLYDNLKSAVLERVGEAIRFHPTLLELSSHYRYEPKPVAVARGNEKGRVERAIGYVRTAFFAARPYTDLADLNQQARKWCLGEAGQRKWPEDDRRTVQEVFEEEKPRLLALPDNPFPAQEKVAVHVGKTPYARFDLNDYSVPHTCVRRTLTVAATEQQVRVLDGTTVVATHTRSYDRGAQVEDAEHVRALTEVKQQARQHRGLDLLHHAVPVATAFFQQMAERGTNLGSATSALLRLLEREGAAALDSALQEALQRGTPHVPAVRQILEQRRHAQGLPPPIAVALPDDPRVRNVVVRPHALNTYDNLSQEPHDDNLF